MSAAARSGCGLHGLYWNHSARFSRILVVVCDWRGYLGVLHELEVQARGEQRGERRPAGDLFLTFFEFQMLTSELHVCVMDVGCVKE